MRRKLQRTAVAMIALFVMTGMIIGGAAMSVTANDQETDIEQDGDIERVESPGLLNFLFGESSGAINADQDQSASGADNTQSASSSQGWELYSDQQASGVLNVLFGDQTFEQGSAQTQTIEDGDDNVQSAESSQDVDLSSEQEASGVLNALIGDQEASQDSSQTQTIEDGDDNYQSAESEQESDLTRDQQASGLLSLLFGSQSSDHESSQEQSVSGGDGNEQTSDQSSDHESSQSQEADGILNAQGADSDQETRTAKSLRITACQDPDAPCSGVSSTVADTMWPTHTAASCLPCRLNTCWTTCRLWNVSRSNSEGDHTALRTQF